STPGPSGPGSAKRELPLSRPRDMAMVSGQAVTSVTLLSIAHHRVPHSSVTYTCGPQRASWLSGHAPVIGNAHTPRTRAVLSIPSRSDIKRLAPSHPVTITSNRSHARPTRSPASRTKHLEPRKSVH